VSEIMQQILGWVRWSLGALLWTTACRPEPASSVPEHPQEQSVVGSQSAATKAAEAKAAWPGGARAAVSLTYDDSMDSQLAPAAGHLDKAGLRATFFLNEVKDDGPWRTLRQHGHELGGHTLHHPCPRSFEVPTTPSEELDLVKMALELDGDVAQLKRLGQAPPFSFAYPCGVTWVGAQQSYVDLVKERFSAARLAADTGTHAEPYMIPAQFGLLTLSELDLAVQRAVDDGRWLVLGFHGIGGGWLVTDAAIHEQFVMGLAARSEVWVAPFGTVAQHLASRQ